MLLLLYSSHEPIGPQPYPVIYVVANPVRGHKEVGTKVNGSHHGNNPLLGPTGIQIATKRYATLQAMAPTNNKTVHQTSFTPYREQPRSTRMIVVAYPRPAFSATNRTNTFQPVLNNNIPSFSRPHIVQKYIVDGQTKTFYPTSCDWGTLYNKYCSVHLGRRYFQHAHFIPIVGVGKRGEYELVHGDLPRQHSFGTTLRFTGPVLADSRQ